MPSMMPDIGAYEYQAVVGLPGPTLKLGLAGSEIELPAIRSFGGGEPGLDFGFDPQVEMTKMSDGTLRAAFVGDGKMSWTYQSGAITVTELASVKAIAVNRRALHFQNNWESAAWYDVVITEFSYRSVSTLMGNLSVYKYSVSLKIQEL